jgi:hypothetical protein
VFCRNSSAGLVAPVPAASFHRITDEMVKMILGNDPDGQLPSSCLLPLIGELVKPVLSAKDIRRITFCPAPYKERRRVIKRCRVGETSIFVSVGEGFLHEVQRSVSTCCAVDVLKEATYFPYLLVVEVKCHYNRKTQELVAKSRFLEIGIGDPRYFSLPEFVNALSTFRKEAEEATLASTNKFMSGETNFAPRTTFRPRSRTFERRTEEALFGWNVPNRISESRGPVVALTT